MGVVSTHTHTRVLPVQVLLKSEATSPGFQFQREHPLPPLPRLFGSASWSLDFRRRCVGRGAAVHPHHCREKEKHVRPCGMGGWSQVTRPATSSSRKSSLGRQKSLIIPPFPTGGAVAPPHHHPQAEPVKPPSLKTGDKPAFFPETLNLLSMEGRRGDEEECRSCGGRGAPSGCVSVCV